jgi:effector-binding domain-containing protein
MKILKYILFFVAGVITLATIVSFFLPSQCHVERSMEMNCTPEQAFPLVNNLKKWDIWSPWHHKDSAMVKNYGDVYEGIGANYSWKSNHRDVGNGSIKYVEVKPNEFIKAEMYFMDNSSAAFGTYKFDKTDKGCKVTWGMDCDMSKPFVIGKFFGMMMDKMIGPDFENGLAELKKASENAAACCAAGVVSNVEEVTVPTINCMQINDECDLKDVGPKLGELYGKLGKAMGEKGCKMAGAPCAMYPGFKDGDTHTKIVACMACDKLCGDCGNGIKCVTMPSVKAVKATFTGPYESNGAAYKKIKEWAAENKKELTENAWEEYANDPGAVNYDKSKYITNVYMVLK